MDFSPFLPGMEKEKKIDIVISFTQIDSEEKILALKRHLVDGMPLAAAAVRYDTDVSNLRKALEVLEAAANKIEEVKEMEWPDYQITRFKKVS